MTASAGAFTGRSPPRKVTVAIPSWNGRRQLASCLPALLEQEDPGVPWDIAVLDNGSTDDTAAWLADTHPRVRLHRNRRNVGFAAACNRLVEESDADAVALLNNATRPETQWLAALVDALAGAPADVVAVAGRVVDGSGERLDFAGGVMTFDGHAFQIGFGQPLQRARVPPTGTELLFATGCNMLVTRRRFLQLGGFDAEYFAYLEDVDFGWRAWSAGQRITFCSEAVVRHRSGATGDRFGNARRGFLFERNAFMTAYKNYDAELFSQMMQATQMTLMSRISASLLRADRRNRWLLEDLPGTDAPTMTSGLRGAARRMLSRLDGRTVRTDAQAEAQLRALAEICRRQNAYAEHRARVQALRAVSDREIFDRFALHIVPTYPGDARLFDGAAFSAVLPPEVRFERRELAQIMERS